MAYLLLEITLPSHQLQNRQGLLSTTNSLTHKTPIQRVKFNGIQLITLCNRGERPLDSAFYAKAPRLGCSSGSDGQTLRAPRHRVRHPSPALCQPRLRQNLQLQKHLPIAAVCPMRAVIYRCRRSFVGILYVLCLMSLVRTPYANCYQSQIPQHGAREEAMQPISRDYWIESEKSHLQPTSSWRMPPHTGRTLDYQTAVETSALPQTTKRNASRS
jgi:hypothetical protein